MTAPEGGREIVVGVRDGHHLFITQIPDYTDAEIALCMIISTAIDNSHLTDALDGQAVERATRWAADRYRTSRENDQ